MDGYTKNALIGGEAASDEIAGKSPNCMLIIDVYFSLPDDDWYTGKAQLVCFD